MCFLGSAMLGWRWLVTHLAPCARSCPMRGGNGKAEATYASSASGSWQGVPLSCLFSVSVKSWALGLCRLISSPLLCFPAELALLWLPEKKAAVFLKPNMWKHHINSGALLVWKAKQQLPFLPSAEVATINTHLSIYTRHCWQVK